MLALDAINTSIAYAEANAAAAHNAHDRDLWAAHARNCVLVREQIELLLALLREVRGERT